MTNPHPKPYARDGVPGLTAEQQLDAINKAGWLVDLAHVDRLTTAQIKRRSPADLKRRAEILRPTTRPTPELIIVASLRCLGWSMADIANALAAAGRRYASVLALDRGETYDHHSLEPKLLEALADAETSRKRAQTAAGRSSGAVAAAARHAKRREKWLKRAKELWVLPSTEITAKEIAQQLGISLRTLNEHLGPRNDARAAATMRKGRSDE